MFNFLKHKPKTDKELLSELNALIDRLYLEQGFSQYDLSRYEDLLAEIYKRGLTPNRKLIRKDESTNSH